MALKGLYQIRQESLICVFAGANNVFDRCPYVVVENAVGPSVCL